MTTRHGEDWTPADHADLRRLLGTMPTADIAAHLGRTPRAVRHQIERQRLIVQDIVSRSGLTMEDAARCIGVSRHTIKKWIRIKILRARRVVSHTRTYYAIAETDLRRLVQTRLAYYPYLLYPSDAAWQEFVAISRWRLRQQYVTYDEIADAICVARGSKKYVRQRGLPAPALSARGTLAALYERRAVAEWLETQPQWCTERARQALWPDR